MFGAFALRARRDYRLAAVGGRASLPTCPKARPLFAFVSWGSSETSHHVSWLVKLGVPRGADSPRTRSSILAEGKRPPTFLPFRWTGYLLPPNREGSGLQTSRTHHPFSNFFLPRPFSFAAMMHTGSCQGAGLIRFRQSLLARPFSLLPIGPPASRGHFFALL